MVSTLKAIRQIAGLSQEQLASELRVSQSLISKFESGERQPDYELRQELASRCSERINWHSLHHLAAKVRQDY